MHFWSFQCVMPHTCHLICLERQSNVCKEEKNKNLFSVLFSPAYFYSCILNSNTNT
jgi:hypothetical protein